MSQKIKFNENISNTECVIEMRNDYYLRDFVSTLLRNGYSVSQSGNPEGDYVSIHIKYDNNKEENANNG